MAVRPNQCLSDYHSEINKTERQIDHALIAGCRRIDVEASSADVIIDLARKYRYAGWTVRYFYGHANIYRMIFA